MRSIVPSAAIAESHVALLSSLRAQGFAVEKPGARPMAGAMWLAAPGEPTPAPARTVVIGGEGRKVAPAHDGAPARIAFGREVAEVGNAFARALFAGADAPTA
ncbi:MAG: AAA family ATPase, partial [Sphingomonas bacterium]